MMVRNSLILIAMVAISCRSPEFTLEGLWYGCERDGSYFELHVSTNYYEFHIEDAPSMVAREHYELQNDSMVYWITQTDQVTEKIRKAKLNVVSNDQILWQAIGDSPSEPQKLSRLEEKINLFPDGSSIEKIEEWEKKIEVEIMRRADIISCPDIRTKEEIIQDSLWRLKFDTMAIDDNFLPMPDFE